MATLITQLNTTQINYQGSAVYVLNVSFNGVVGSIQSAKIKVFIPEILQYTIGDVQEPVKNVSEESVQGGRRITFDFGSIQDLGTSTRLSIGVQFKLTTPLNTTFVCEPELWINEALYETSVADTLTLYAVSNFQLESYLILPTMSPAPGGTAVFIVDLENFGDKGVEIADVAITCQLPVGLTIDPTFAMIGKDESSPPFNDSSQDGVVGTVQGNGFTFNISSYKGYEYRFMYRVSIDGTLPVGLQITTAIGWTLGGVAQANGNNVITLAAPTYHGAISKYGPDYTMPDAYIRYELYVTNDGNQPLANIHLIDELPTEVVAYEFWTGTFWIGAIEKDLGGAYSITYTTRNGLSGTLGPFNTDVNSRVDLTTIIPVGDQLATVSWDVPLMSVGLVQKQPPSINGKVKADTPIGRRILNHFDFDWDTPTGRAHTIDNQNAVVQDLCVLYPQLEEVSPNKPVNPGDYITYKITLNCRKSRLLNPFIAALLPEQLQYVGLIGYTYEDPFPNPPTLPAVPVQVIPNFKNTGKTLVKASFSGAYAFRCRQNARLTLSVRTQVKIGAKDKVVLNILLNNTLDTGIIPAGVDIYRDTLDIADNGTTGVVYAMTPEVINKILFFASTASNKKVKGALDTLYTEEPQIGHTLEGGLVEYMLSITNVGNADLHSVEIVDILPHKGDTGVIMTEQARLSQYAIYNMNAVTSSIQPLQQGQAEPIIQMMYSRSYNPIRFGGSFNTIGSDNDWSPTLPPVSTELHSFKVMTQNTVLYPGQTLTVKIQGVAPVGVVSGDIAWNSFAAKVSYIDLNGNIQYLLAVEPEKVGVQIMGTPPGMGEIGGIVFEDKDGNGIFGPGDVGVNDVGVVLYNEQLVPIQAIFTAPDVEGNPGYYLFSNLALGKYYVRYIIDEPEYKFTVQRLDVPEGSKPNPQTGITPRIDLHVQSSQTEINAGIVKRPTPERMDIALQVNASANKMLRNVVHNQILLGMKLEDVKNLIE
ncbi:MAG: SdrD B-like domain-containing protein [Cellulosilyticaceae bacterium]